MSTHSLHKLIQRTAHFETMAEQQRRPDWLARFRLRPDYEEPELPPIQQWLFEQGIVNLYGAQRWLQAWVANGQKALPIMCLGRDMCWQISLLLEILEGRYVEDLLKDYSPQVYLNSRYGVPLYFAMWDQSK